MKRQMFLVKRGEWRASNQPRLCVCRRRSAGRTCPGRRRAVRWGRAVRRWAAVAGCGTAGVGCGRPTLNRCPLPPPRRRYRRASSCGPGRPQRRGGAAVASSCWSPGDERCVPRTDAPTAGLHSYQQHCTHWPDTLLHPLNNSVPLTLWLFSITQIC